MTQLANIPNSTIVNSTIATAPIAPVTLAPAVGTEIHAGAISILGASCCDYFVAKFTFGPRTVCRNRKNVTIPAPPANFQFILGSQELNYAFQHPVTNIEVIRATDAATATPPTNSATAFAAPVAWVEVTPVLFNFRQQGFADGACC